MKGFIKPILVLIFLSAVIFLIYWLWQRQPKSSNPQSPQASQNATNSNSSDNQNPLSLNLKDGQAFDLPNLNLSGKASPNSQILIFSNSFDVLISSNDKGNFQTQINLDKGLNLINLAQVNSNFKETQKQILTLYLLGKNEPKTNTVYAGTVKNIFDNVLTIAAISGGDEKVRQTNQTQINLPATASPTPKTSTSNKSQNIDIRVGDFIIALGSNAQNQEITAESINILRDNKPTITKKYAFVTISSTVKSKIFSSTDLTNSNLLEFKLDTNAVISASTGKADEKSLIKGKKALVFYTPGSDNIVSSVYILP